MGLQEKIDQLIQSKVEAMIEKSLEKALGGLEKESKTDDEILAEVKVDPKWKPGFDKNVQKATNNTAMSGLKKTYPLGKRNVRVFEFDTGGSRFVDDGTETEIINSK